MDEDEESQLLDEDEESQPPDGYQFASIFKYPRRLLYFAKYPPVLISLGLYLSASSGMIGGGVFRGFAGWGVVVFISVVFFSIDTVRGLIQRGICRLLGYSISSFYPLLDPLEPTFAAAPGQFQCRRDALLIAIAPLSLFFLLGIALLFVLPEVISGILAFVLIVNVSGAAWDIYFIGWLLRRPKGTLLFTETILRLSVFEPELSEVSS